MFFLTKIYHIMFMMQKLIEYVVLRIGDSFMWSVIGWFSKSKPKETDFIDHSKRVAIDYFKNNPDKAIVPAWKVINTLKAVLSAPVVDKTITASVIADLVPHLNVTECAIIGKAILRHPSIKPIVVCLVVIILVQLFNNRFFIYRIFSERGCLSGQNYQAKSNTFMDNNNKIDLTLLSTILKEFLSRTPITPNNVIESEPNLSKRDILISKNRDVNRAQSNLMNVINALLNNDNGGV